MFSIFKFNFYFFFRYCLKFLKSLECFNKECLYLHYNASSNDILERDDMNGDSSIFLQQQIQAIELADILSEKTKYLLKQMKQNKTILPSPHTIYDKEIVIEEIKKRLNKFNYDSNFKKECLFFLNKEDLKSEQILSTTDNDSSKDQDISDLKIESSNNLYISKQDSRFNFSKKSSNSSIRTQESINIPSYITNLIQSKCSKYTLFHNLNSSFNLNEKTSLPTFLIASKHPQDDWALFISSLAFNDMKKQEEEEEFLECDFLKKFNTK